MELNFGFQYYSGLVQYAKSQQIIAPFKENMAIISPFVAVTRYEKNEQVFEILYSEDLFMLECFVTTGHIYRVRLDELLKATKKVETTEEVQSQIAAQPQSLTSAIHTLAAMIRDNADRLIDANPKLFERALTIRERLLEHNIREQHKKDLEQTREEAARAFVRKDFPKVVELFHPFEMYLSPTDLKKLEQARKKLRSA